MDTETFKLIVRVGLIAFLFVVFFNVMFNIIRSEHPFLKFLQYASYCVGGLLIGKLLDYLQLF